MSKGASEAQSEDMKRHRFAAVAGAGAMLAVAGFIGLGALMGELADRLNQS